MSSIDWRSDGTSASPLAVWRRLRTCRCDTPDQQQRLEAAFARYTIATYGR